MFDNYNDILTVGEIQKMLKIGRNAVYSLLKSGTIKSIKIGKKYIVPKKSVVEFVTTSSK